MTVLTLSIIGAFTAIAAAPIVIGFIDQRRIARDEAARLAREVIDRARASIRTGVIHG